RCLRGYAGLSSVCTSTAVPDWVGLGPPWSCFSAGPGSSSSTATIPTWIWGLTWSVSVRGVGREPTPRHRRLQPRAPELERSRLAPPPYRRTQTRPRLATGGHRLSRKSHRRPAQSWCLRLEGLALRLLRRPSDRL